MAQASTGACPEKVVSDSISALKGRERQDYSAECESTAAFIGRFRAGLASNQGVSSGA
jgi:hypothetical protein